ncbi:DUF982 domain-containing protein [Neorhizobium galegae]|uniref:DUF982 domain-containing protein n=1 Tax=Neorhizobium galegae TaxID=399 RepID=UPI00351D3B49
MDLAAQFLSRGAFPCKSRWGTARRNTSRNSTQVLDCLLNRWPTGSGMYFEAARTKCDGAIRRIIAGEDARDGFISAAIDAHVLAY